MGKFYLGTPPHLDSQRNLFTLYTDAMSSYQLGTHDLKVETQPAASAVVLSKQEQRTPFPRDVCGDGAEAAASSRAVEEVREEITTDLAKVRCLCDTRGQTRGGAEGRTRRLFFSSGLNIVR